MPPIGHIKTQSERIQDLTKTENELNTEREKQIAATYETLHKIPRCHEGLDPSEEEINTFFKAIGDSCTVVGDTPATTKVSEEEKIVYNEFETKVIKAIDSTREPFRAMQKPFDEISIQCTSAVKAKESFKPNSFSYPSLSAVKKFVEKQTVVREALSYAQDDDNNSVISSIIKRMPQQEQSALMNTLIKIESFSMFGMRKCERTDSVEGHLESTLPKLRENTHKIADHINDLLSIEEKLAGIKEQILEVRAESAVPAASTDTKGGSKGTKRGGRGED